MTPTRRRIVLIAGGAVAIVVIAGVITWSSLRTSEGPVEAVTDYVTLIAGGDTAGATALVDPADYTGYRGEGKDASAGLSPARSVAESDLVVDEGVLLATPTTSITIDTVRLDYGDTADVAVGETVEVQVDYSVEGRMTSNRAYLRSERLPDTWYGFTQWRVVDPLLLPVIVQTNQIGVDLGLLGDAPIDFSGPAANGAPQHATLVYPGSYELGSSASTYLSADAKTVTIEHTTFEVGSDPDLGAVQQLQLFYGATPALYNKIDALIPAYIADCIAAGADLEPNCPSELIVRSGWAQNVTLAEEPTIDDITSYQVEFVDGLPVKPSLHANSKTIPMNYTIDDGVEMRRSLRVLAWVIPHGDDVEIEFRSDF